MIELGVFLAAAAAVERFVNLVKPWFDGVPDRWRDAAMKGLAVLGGVLLALMSGGTLNLFGPVAALPPLAGVILTGLVVGLGADAVHGVFGLLYGWRDVVREQANFKAEEANAQWRPSKRAAGTSLRLM